MIASELETQLRALAAEKNGNYERRTEYLDSDDEPVFINRLIREDSPYLLQHAHNPVNWYAWGDEAFAAAKSEGKPVFLSIGYSTCHWCHVMEVESFDNVEVAKVLNQGFISIKMDREQHPDIDEFYMTGVQIMSGHGGWPMSNFLTQEGQPFFGATYFPAASFITLLQKITEAWQTKNAELQSSANKIASSINEILSDSKEAASLSQNIGDDCVEYLLKREDQRFGGLEGAPKFPQEPLLLFLLDEGARDRNLEALAFVDRALEGMAGGGIYDQVGGGFHRYSVDEEWLVPHFEKMLYNQSQLGLVYLYAWQLTGKPFFERICRQTLDYVVRDMQSPQGSFYSASDADSEGVEGTFFLWSIEQLEEVLDTDELAMAVKVFGVTKLGNFEASNILNLAKSLEDLELEAGELEAGEREIEGNDFFGQLDNVLEKLYLARERRIPPFRDDKIIVAWAAAMVNTMAKASWLMDELPWLQVAEKAAHTMWTENVNEACQLQRISLNGTVSIPGQLEDYANFSQALISLFDVTSKLDYLQKAAGLVETMLTQFWDHEHEGFFLSPMQQAGPKLGRSRNASDGATLSPVATALHCLLMLKQRSALITDHQHKPNYENKIDKCIASSSSQLTANPVSHTGMLGVINHIRQGSLETIQYAADGRAKVSIRKSSSKQEGAQPAVKTQNCLEIKITLLSAWHITAAREADKHYVPIEVAIEDDELHWQIVSCDYPQAHGVLQGMHGDEIAIYENEFCLKVLLKATETSADLMSNSVGFSLTLQLCNDESCLLPESLHFRI